MRVARLKTERGQFTVVIGDPGRKFTQYVQVDYPVRLRKIANADVARYASDINYPTKRACRRMLKFGGRSNITKGARTFLKEGLK